MPGYEHNKAMDYHALNAQLNLFAADGSIQFDKDHEAAEAYLNQQVIPNTKQFASVWERLEWLIENEYYEAEYLRAYDKDFVERLHEQADAFGHKFQTFLGAFKFFTSYALKTFDGSLFLENFEQRVVATALFLGQGDEELASKTVTEILSGRFQPATPTFLNAGKKQRGELVSCFLLRVEDNLESIGRSVNSALQLSKREDPRRQLQLREPARRSPGRRRCVPARAPPRHYAVPRHEA